jgi:hypothetical protein
MKPGKTGPHPYCQQLIMPTWSDEVDRKSPPSVLSVPDLSMALTNIKILKVRLSGRYETRCKISKA